MRYSRFWPVCTIIPLLVSGCVSSASPPRPPAFQARFVAPPAAEGGSRYETANLALEIKDARPRFTDSELSNIMMATLVVENRRGVMAWIDSTRSCVVDGTQGAHNLVWADWIIPAGSFAAIRQPHPLPMVINFAGFWMGPARVSDYHGGRVRVVLRMRWDDGQTEDADVEYEVVPGEERRPGG